MLIPDHERFCSSSWKLDRLKRASTRQEATDYLADYWASWIAIPMLGPIPNGGWAQITLGCLAVEACAWFWRPFSRWQGETWPRANKPSLTVQKSQGTTARFLHDELHSEAAFGWMFRLVFSGEQPPALTIEQLAEVVYKVFRCGLAHRGLSKDCIDSGWLGVIDGQARIFRHLTDGKQNALSIDPDRFVQHVDAWFRKEVVQVLSVGGAPDIDKAFKEWCGERWEIRETNWNF